MPTVKKMRKLEFRPLKNTINPEMTYLDALKLVLEGRASSDEVVAICHLRMQLKPSAGYVMLSADEYALVLRRVNGYTWNAVEENIEGECAFIEYVRTLPEIDVDVSPAA